MEKVLVDEMENNSLDFVGEDGKAYKVPILGIFAIQDKHYVVLLMESDDKVEQEQLCLKILNDGQGDYVQMIDQKDEWLKVVKAWEDICAKVEKKDYRRLED